MIDIFAYLDYRSFLKDQYEEQRKLLKYFTYRYIAGKTGLDASFYVKVLQKQLHLSDKSLPTLIEFLNLDPLQGRYFTLLVKFNKAKSTEDRAMYFEKLAQLKDSDSTTLESDQSEYFQREFLQRAHEALDAIPKEERDFSTLTFSLSRNLLPVVRERIAEMRKELVLMANVDPDADCVYHLNVQLFPLLSKQPSESP